MVIAGGIAFASTAMGADGSGGSENQSKPLFSVPVGLTPHEECDALQKDFGDSPLQVRDGGTGQILTKTTREWCYTRADALPPREVQDEAGLTSLQSFKDGAVHLDWYEKRTQVDEVNGAKTEATVTGPEPLAADVAQARLADAARRLGVAVTWPSGP